MALALLVEPPRVPKSNRPPLLKRKAWVARLPLVYDSPATCPWALMACPWLTTPPRVPKSFRTPPPYIMACAARLPVVYEKPVSWPVPLNALPWKTEPPSVGRLVMVVEPLWPHAQMSTAANSSRTEHAPPMNLNSLVSIVACRFVRCCLVFVIDCPASRQAWGGPTLDSLPFHLGTHFRPDLRVFPLETRIAW